LILNLVFPDFFIGVGTEFICINISLSKIELSNRLSEAVFGGLGNELNILDCVLQIKVMDLKILSELRDVGI
jgi:hypothetical protein